MTVKISEVIYDPGIIRAFFSRRPFSLSAYRLVKSLVLHGCAPATVIDIGANEGQFSRAIIETFPSASIYGFEPLAKAYDRLVKHFAGDSRVKFIKSALGAETGSAVLNVNSFSQSSSLLPLGENHQQAFPLALEIGCESIAIMRLDAVIHSEDLIRPVLLKIDVQGYELEVLKGAGRALSQVDYILVEIGLVPLYVGEPSFQEINTFLKGEGFRFVAPLSKLRNEKKGIDIQMDALFFRDE